MIPSSHRRVVYSNSTIVVTCSKRVIHVGWAPTLYNIRRIIYSGNNSRVTECDKGYACHIWKMYKIIQMFLMTYHPRSWYIVHFYRRCYYIMSCMFDRHWSVWRFVASTIRVIILWLTTLKYWYLINFCIGNLKHGPKN